LIDGLSALDNVLLPAYFDHWRPDPELKQRAHELLIAVGISALDRVAAVLSRGERQRVAFARALLFRPTIVMADEPTASLDPITAPRLAICWSNSFTRKVQRSSSFPTSTSFSRGWIAA